MGGFPEVIYLLEGGCLSLLLFGLLVEHGKMVDSFSLCLKARFADGGAVLLALTVDLPAQGLHGDPGTVGPLKDCAGAVASAFGVLLLLLLDLPGSAMGTEQGSFGRGSLTFFAVTHKAFLISPLDICRKIEYNDSAGIHSWWFVSMHGPQVSGESLIPVGFSVFLGPMDNVRRLQWGLDDHSKSLS